MKRKGIDDGFDFCRGYVERGIRRGKRNGGQRVIIDSVV
jgi:hypothetical protein